MENKDLYCPYHNVKLVLKEARRGKNVGSKFWGCPTYSKTKCNYTIPYGTKSKKDLSLKEEFLSKIKNKKGKISPLKIIGFILAIPFYIIYEFMNNMFPLRKHWR